MSLKHLNDNILCAVDTETTGLDPRKHDLIQVAVIPLNDFYRPRSDIMPFTMKLKPRNIKTAQAEAIRTSRADLTNLMLHGVDYYDAADLFDRWYNEILKVSPNKRIMPLAHNWPFDRDFLREWLTPEGFDLYFSGHYRDSMVAAMYLNDRAEHHTEVYPNPKMKLTYLCTHHGINLDNAHDAIADAVAAAELYKRFLDVIC